MTGCYSSKKTARVPVNTQLLEQILTAKSPLFDSVLANREQWKVQVIYTQIDRQPNGDIAFTDHYFNVNPDQYFYPASTVKLPVSILALQQLKSLNNNSIDRHTLMITESASPDQTLVYNDPEAPDGWPSIDRYIRKILLVSDNDAFNRLYEFLGQEYINTQLKAMDYNRAEIIHRLSIVLSEEQNRHTNPVRFIDSTGNTLYQQPAQQSKLKYANRHDLLGRGYLQNGVLVDAPFDFSRKNRFPLPDLHQVLRSLLFPRAVPANQRFDLRGDDRDFLLKYLSMLPRQSEDPVYDSARYKDNYAKLFLPADPSPQQQLRVFSKAGWAYGFLTDVAYITDSVKQVEFMLSATIYCNSDGIFNDDQYDYEKIGYPFFRALSSVLYDYELKRERTIVPGK